MRIACVLLGADAFVALLSAVLLLGVVATVGAAISRSTPAPGEVNGTNLAGALTLLALLVLALAIAKVVTAVKIARGHPRARATAACLLAVDFVVWCLLTLTHSVSPLSIFFDLVWISVVAGLLWLPGSAESYFG